MRALLFGLAGARINSASMPVLFLIVFIDLVGFGLVIPLLPFYAARFGASPQEVTLLLAVYSLVSMVTAPLWGRLSDRIGRRPVLMASTFAAALAYLWMGFADSLWMLYAARALAGACAGNIAAAQAYIADVTTPENRARGMGMIGAAFGFGFIIGPALGGAVAGNNLANADLRTPGLIACALSLIALVGVIVMLRESLDPAARARPRRSRLAAIRGAFGRPILSRLLLIFFLATLAFSGMEATFALWAMRQFSWGPAQVGYIFTYVGVLLALMQGGAIGPLTKRLGEERLMLAGLGLIAVGLAILPSASGLVQLVVSTGLLAFGMGAMQPSLNSLISRRAGLDQQGETLGVAQSVSALSRVLGPALAGVLFAGLGAGSPFVSGAVLVVAALVVGLRLPRIAAEPGA
ncbi:MAG TPA: MFS transporter [Stellaceae bacterium]|nr:MFS transporter [Stellaceae bacterium]